MSIVLPICAAYALWCLATMPAAPITTPDSVHYLNAAAIVPLGYPLFLKIAGARGAMVVQPILFSAALALLGRETIRVTRSTVAGGDVVAGAMLVPQVKDFHASILTESLFMSAVIVFLALMIRFVQQPSWHLMVLARDGGRRERHDPPHRLRLRAGVAVDGACCSATGYCRDRRRRSSCWRRPSPFAGIITTEQLAARVVHDGQTSSLMGRHLFAKAALIDAPTGASRRSGCARDGARIETSTKTTRRFARCSRRAPRDVRAVLTINYETCLQGLCAERSRDLMPDRAEPDQTAIMGRVGAERASGAPRSSSPGWRPCITNPCGRSIACGIPAPRRRSRSSSRSTGRCPSRVIPSAPLRTM